MSDGSALAGLLVIDAATMVAGPLAASLLADFGATVVKVEPIAGDESRTFGPRRGAESGVFVGVNRNKRGIALDLRVPEGRDVYLALCERADVVIDNMRPAPKRRLGVDAETLRARNPRLIALTVSSFGEVGPYAQRPGLDPVAQALTGFMEATGAPEGEPVKAGPPVADAACGHLAAVAVLVALLARERTGEGQVANVSLVDALIHLQAPWVGQYFLSGEPPPRSGNRSNFYAPYDTFTTSDGGRVHVVAFNDRYFGNLCRAVEREDLIEDERFADGAGRMRHQDALATELAPWFHARTRAQAVERLQAHDVIHAPVLRYDETFADPQVVAGAMAVAVEHRLLGELRVPGVPAKLERTPGSVRMPPPTLGEHTDELLGELGYGAEHVERLRAAGAVG